MRNLLTFRFIPSLLTPKLAAPEDFPELGVKFVVDKGRGEIISSTHLVLDERMADILMPTKPTDLRFARRVLYWHSKITAWDLQAFVQRVKGTIDGEGPLRAPTDLNVMVPAWTRRKGNKHLNKKEQEKLRGPDLVMKYLFAGVSFQQEMAFDFEERQLLYKSIEAGTVGGRRNELELYQKVHSDHIEANLGSERPLVVPMSKFVQSAFRLADQVHDSSPEQSQKQSRAQATTS